ncbi:MAG TPA: ABC transporter ATP-binding protein [Polyangia bacterium]|nr:ABC transporter ATP-binding protein [Polyangia bacterium]
MSEREPAPTIQLRGVSKWYGTVAALSDLSMSARSGVVGLLGPSGAGKTSLLRILVGQSRPTRGEALVLGERPWRNLPLMRRLGYCPEHEGVYEELTAIEFVTMLTRLHGFDPAESRRRAEAALERTGLADTGDKRMGAFSKGMRQRAKLAQALAHEPDVLILDEPLNGCDPLGRAELIRLIRELGAAGRTILVSSHVLYEVEAMTGEIRLLFRGQLLAEGNVHRIRELIDAHPHRIEVECDRPRVLGQALLAEEHVLRVGISGPRLVVETRTPDAAYSLIAGLALERGIKITRIHSPDDNLQAVFRYLTEKREEAA